MADLNKTVQDADRVFIRVDEVAHLLGISRSLAYEMANRWIRTKGREGLPAVRLGRRILINRSRLIQWAECQAAPEAAD
jgi:excisionase family DNA binding protein